MAGTTLSQNALNQYASQVLCGVLPEIQEGLSTAKALFMLFWPTSYTGMALYIFVTCCFGARTVYKSIDKTHRNCHSSADGSFHFDVPYRGQLVCV